MNTESIVSVVLAVASALKGPATLVTSQRLNDLYAATKYYLRKKFMDRTDAAQALEFAMEKPWSVARKATLVEEAEPAELHRDAELVALIARLKAELPQPLEAERVSVNVEARNNQVYVAGGDLFVSPRLVRRDVITPDNPHLAREQRTRLLLVIHELAARLGGEDGAPNLGAVHAMLQRRFNVSSYLFIPRERYPEALAFLRQHRAIHRGVLRRRNPAAFRQDLFRAIFSRGTELGWSREQIYDFARERLGLNQPVTSLKQLGTVQLQSLMEKLRRLLPGGRVL